MSKCKDPKLGSLLPAYELGGLMEVEIEKFEIHLIECPYCFDELKGFQTEANLLKNDHDVRQLISDNAREATTESGTLLKKLWKYLWPDRPIIFKPVLAYFIIALMLIPAYRGFFVGSKENVIRGVQTVNLFPDRAMAVSQFSLGNNQDGLLSFVFRGALPGQFYSVTIKSKTGETIFEDKHFSNFDEYETGRLLLPLDQFAPGEYRLIIMDSSSPSLAGRQEYIFRITK